MRFTIGIVPFVLSCANIFAAGNNTATVDEQNSIARAPNALAFTPAPESLAACQQPKSKPQPRCCYPSTEQQTSSRPQARCCNSDGPYFVGSIIYWRTKLDVMDTVIEVNALAFSPDVPVVVKIKDPSTEYSPGFKAGVGYNFKRDTWDTFFNWTRIGSHKSKDFTSSIQGLVNLLISTTVGPIPLELSGEIDTHWKTLFNSLDWELGKSFLVGRYLALRPFAGVKGGWLHTGLKINQKDTPLSFVINEKLTNRNWGVGPRLGLNSRWILSRCNLGVVANIAGSLLLEQIKNKLYVAVNDPSLGIVEPFIVVGKAKHEILAPVVEFFLGLDWGICYNKERFYFNVAVGVEGQYWPNQQLIGTVLATNPSNNLNMYGLTGSMRFDF